MTRLGWRWWLALGVAVILVGPGEVGAQLAPEAKKALDPLVGTWRLEVDIKAVGAMAASKGTGTDTCEWFAAMHLVCKAELTGPTGKYQSMRTISYVPQQGKYLSHFVDSLGYAVNSIGEAGDGSLVFASELGGYRSRVTLKVAGASYTSVTDWAGPDGKWTVASEDKGTRR